MKLEQRTITTLVADDGKLLQRKSDGWVAGERFTLGYDYYEAGVGLAEPRLATPEDFEEIDKPEDWEVKPIINQVQRLKRTDELIKQNKAQMIEGAEDLIQAMQWESAQKCPVQTQMVDLLCDLSETQRQLYELLLEAEDGLHINQLVMETQRGYSQVASELVMMELEDVVKSMPGGMWRMKK